MAETRTLKIPEEAAGLRLDAWLGEHYGSRTAAVRAIDSGLVTVDGEARPKSWPVSEGESVVLIAPAAKPAVKGEAGPPIEVVFIDEWLMVVSKPPNLVVHPAPGHQTGTLSQLLAHQIGGGEEERAGIVHRLDQHTSGLMILARQEESHRVLRQMLEDRDVKRGYKALVIGAPETREGTIDAAIGRDRRVRTRMSTSTDTPRDAVTHFVVDEAFLYATLLDVSLQTGRTHQIRAHLKVIGLPVAGDPEYGVTNAYGLERQFLHSASLSFSHPITAEPLGFESNLPDDLAAALERARVGEVPLSN
ncbi:MAG: RluA family pseudouridine synthase [Solirubrobacterales bacterium]|nr:RluA family pseudouridine synthase [Solirubrobacterales bacterium]